MFTGTKLEQKTVQRILADPFVQQALTDGQCVIRILSPGTGRVLYVSDNCQEVLGFDATDVVHANVLARVPSTEVAHARQTLQRMMEGDTVSRYRIDDGKGGFLWVCTRSRPIEGFLVGCVQPETDPSMHVLRTDSVTD